MSELTLSQTLDSIDRVDGDLNYPLPPNWMQGRTGFGGFTAALLLHAARAQQPDLPPLRSAMINFTAPVTEGPSVSAEVLRRGRNVTTLLSRARVGGTTGAVGTFTFGAPQQSKIAVECPAKTAPAPEDTPSYLPQGLTKAPIPFLDNFELQLIEGQLPFAGSDKGYNRVWARHRDPKMWNRLEGLIALADVLPPMVFPLLKAPTINSSMNWMINLLSESVQTRDGWWLMENQLTAGRDGYSSQVMRIWNTDGELVIDGMQSVIIFG
ncbi:thioesterase family protein [Ruegeria sp. Ofav3-42]|uniref:thioesterase family protein n=1 Tax=Ruegeria sp. Ofav3-42 TaxID=2917759 RepID=UPI001EF4C5DD|nr:thioesterase family protein [Ruegeria sp. Ofav3-42]MCG7518422.1 thioesterase family protein [Ruegeria sp. Ofav3-42]